MPWKKSDGTYIKEGKAWVGVDGTKYPAVWTRFSDTELKTFGLTWEDPPASQEPFDSRFYWGRKTDGSFNNTAPTTSVVSIGTDSTVNQNTATYVMYCFANVEGYCRIGGYVGNGSTAGTFIYTGFEPAWIITKRTDSSLNWYINDSGRSPANSTDLFGGNLYADSANAESGNGMDMLSNGFRIRNTDS